MIRRTRLVKRCTYQVVPTRDWNLRPRGKLRARQLYQAFSQRALCVWYSFAVRTAKNKRCSKQKGLKTTISDGSEVRKAWRLRKYPWKSTSRKLRRKLTRRNYFSPRKARDIIAIKIQLKKSLFQIIVAADINSEAAIATSFNGLRQS